MTKPIEPSLVELARWLETSVEDYDDCRNGYGEVRFRDGELVISFESVLPLHDEGDEDTWPTFTKRFKLIEEEDA